jgi:hypothetical protein
VGGSIARTALRYSSSQPILALARSPGRPHLMEGSQQERPAVSDQADQLNRLKAALASRYRIERQLGQGGMATVYLTEDLRHDRKVHQGPPSRTGRRAGR